MKWLISLVSVACATLVHREAAAEFSLAEADGWKLTLDGRLNTFASVSFGDAQPSGVPTWSGGLE